MGNPKEQHSLNFHLKTPSIKLLNSMELNIWAEPLKFKKLKINQFKIETEEEKERVSVEIKVKETPQLKLQLSLSVNYPIILMLTQ